MKKTSSILKFCIGICFILGILYIVGIADLDYGYYTFLRIFSFISLIALILVYWGGVIECDESFLNPITIIAGIIAILFNPLMPIYLDKDVWVVLDLICGITMIGLGVYIIIKHVLKNRKNT